MILNEAAFFPEKDSAESHQQLRKRRVPGSQREISMMHHSLHTYRVNAASSFFYLINIYRVYEILEIHQRAALTRS